MNNKKNELKVVLEEGKFLEKFKTSFNFFNQIRTLLFAYFVWGASEVIFLVSSHVDDLFIQIFILILILVIAIPLVILFVVKFVLSGVTTSGNERQRKLPFVRSEGTITREPPKSPSSPEKDEIAFCRKCGSPVGENLLYCQKCGNKVR